MAKKKEIVPKVETPKKRAKPLVMHKESGANYYSTKAKVLPAVSELFIDDKAVVSVSHFERFKQISKSKWITSERFQKTSDINLVVDLFQRSAALYESCSHLPTSEVRMIRAKKMVVECYYAKMMTQRSLATGGGVPRISDLSSIAIEQKKSEVLELFGKMFDINEVHRIINQDWGLDVAKWALEKFRVINIEKITELQQEYTRNFTNVRLGYKKSRLEEYSWLYQDTKSNYLAFRKSEDKKLMSSLLESIKREVEGDLIRIEGDIAVNIEATLNVHIQKEVMKKLPINELVITRLSSRLGINPLVMLWRLQNSYYAKFSGFKPSNENVRELEPDYPSAFVYDLDKLNQMHSNRLINVSQKEELFNKALDISVEMKDKAKSIKEILQEKMLEKAKQLKESKAYLDGKTSID